MEENNVFNSFSFKKWSDYVRNEKIENEILKQRMEQVFLNINLKIIGKAFNI